MRDTALISLRNAVKKSKRKGDCVNFKRLYENLSVGGFSYLTETGDLSGLQFIFSTYEIMEKCGVDEYYSDFTIYSMLNFYYYLLDVKYRFALDDEVLYTIYEVVDYFSTIVDQYVVKDNDFYKLLCTVSALIAVLIPDKEPQRISYLHIIDESVVDSFVSGLKFYHLGILTKKLNADAAFQALEKALKLFDESSQKSLLRKNLTQKNHIRDSLDVIYGEYLK